MLTDQLKATFASSNGERSAAAFLRQHPQLVVWAFCKTGGHSKYVLHEFPIGISHKADFVIPFSYSGTWEVHFVELEPVSDKVMTKAGNPSRRLNAAISQIGDWREYVEKNRANVQRDLASWCVRKDLLGWHKMTQPRNYTGDLLKDPESFVRFYYHIVIGRRDEMLPEARRKVNQYRSSGSLEIRSYDLFVDIAENFDRREAEPNASVNQQKPEDTRACRRKALAGRLKLLQYN